MTLVIILVFAAVVSLLIIIGAAVSRSLQLSGRRKLAGIQPVDVEAFRNLVNPADDEFLRANLRSSEFRQVQRARLRATAGYVLQVGKNAGLLVRVGQTALASPDPRIREAARELINDALLVRRNAGFAVLRIYLALAWPQAGREITGIADRYEQLSGVAMLLGRLQNPAAAVRIAAQ